MECQVCGNHYDNAFTVTLADESFVFDCFECAIHALAPTCAHCGCKIIGHGVEHEAEVFCCEHCARQMSGDGDRAFGDDGEQFEDDLGALDSDHPSAAPDATHRRS